MSYLLRLALKVVCVYSMVCFVAMVTGVSLHLHFLSHEHPEEHDSEHCSVCQQLLIVPGKFIVESETSLFDSILQRDIVEFQSQSDVIAFHFDPFGPRPPPQLRVS
jgi:hypothetical protein